MWILLVEDEKKLANSLQKGLKEEGHVVEVRHNGEEAELEGLVNDYDLVILDWRLPGKNGKAILNRWREEGREFPVLMLTALGDLDHRVEGLDTGADDYMSKPFSFEELLARIRALGRRSSNILKKETTQIGPITLDSRRHIVKICREELQLRPKEFILLELLINDPESVYSKTQIAERVWGSSYYVSDNTIEATISTLRQKLADTLFLCDEIDFNSTSQVIETVRGAGYRFNATSLENNTSDE